MHSKVISTPPYKVFFLIDCLFVGLFGGLFVWCFLFVCLVVCFFGGFFEFACLFGQLQMSECLSWLGSFKADTNAT